MEFRSRIHRVERALAKELPGEAAKRRFWPRKFPSEPGPDDSVSHAAVLVCLFPESDDKGPTALPLMERTAVHGDVHSGQISLPGGSFEAGEDAVACALREAHEELGIRPDTLRVLGQLSPHWIPVSGYLVEPVVATCAERPRFIADDREVAAVIQTTIEQLEDPQLRGTFQFERDSRRMEIPCWKLEEGTLWGATAMILAELLAMFEGATGGPAPR